MPLGLKVTSGLDLGPGHYAHNVNINIIHGDSGSPSKRENGSTLERHSKSVPGAVTLIVTLPSDAQKKLPTFR